MAQLRIRELPKEDRPREKLLARGANALTNAELIAILLRTGLHGANAVDVAAQLLKKYPTLNALSRCSVEEISAIRGIGRVKALHLVAAFNLGHRIAQEQFTQQKIDTPELLYNF